MDTSYEQCQMASMGHHGPYIGSEEHPCDMPEGYEHKEEPSEPV